MKKHFYYYSADLHWKFTQGVLLGEATRDKTEGFGEADA